MIDFLTHPYVIIFIVISVIVSNIMLLKYTANMGMKIKKPETEKTGAEKAKEIPTEDLKADELPTKNTSQDLTQKADK